MKFHFRKKGALRKASAATAALSLACAMMLMGSEPPQLLTPAPGSSASSQTQQDPESPSLPSPGESSPSQESGSGSPSPESGGSSSGTSGESATPGENSGSSSGGSSGSSGGNGSGSSSGESSSGGSSSGGSSSGGNSSGGSSGGSSSGGNTSGGSGSGGNNSGGNSSGSGSGGDSSGGSGSGGSKPENPQPGFTPRGQYIVGYYPYYARSSGFTPLSLSAGMLTHIHYAFADVTAAGEVVMANPATDLANFADLRTLKGKYPHLKTLISVGGWSYSKYISNAAATASARKLFAQSCVEFITAHGFDGVDIDWEFPVSGGMAGNVHRPADRENFTLLLRELRAALDAQGQKDGRTYYLSIAGGAGSDFVRNTQLGAISNVVDYIFLMGYDMHGPWDGYADFNAPLYTPEEDSPQYTASVQDSVDRYLAQGVSASKLVLGMPFYGYRYQVTESWNNGLYSPFTASRSVSYDTLASQYLGVYDRFFHEGAQVPYLFNGSWFITYDDPDSIAAKTRYAKSLGLAGVGAWELSQDKSARLLSSAYRALMGG